MDEEENRPFVLQESSLEQFLSSPETIIPINQLLLAIGFTGYDIILMAVSCLFFILVSSPSRLNFLVLHLFLGVNLLSREGNSQTVD